MILQQGYLMEIDHINNNQITLQGDNQQIEQGQNEQVKVTLVEPPANFALEYAEQLQSLKGGLIQNQAIISELKQSISQKKSQLLELNKSPLKLQTPATKSSLSKYFSRSQESNTKTERYLKERIKEFRSEIESTRKQLNQLVKRKNSNAGMIKITQQLQRLSNKKAEYKKILGERDILLRETKDISKDIQDTDLQEILGRSSLQKIEHSELSGLIRQEKLTLQTLEKQDRHLTQKIQFFLNLIGKKEGALKLKTEITTEISVEMKGISNQVKILLQERDGVDVETKRTLDQLKSNIKTVQSSNWTIVNKLREYDAYLLKHYNQKARRKSNAALYNSIQQIPEKNLRQERVTQPTKQAESIVKKKLLIEICRGEKTIKLSDYQLKPDRILSIEIFHHNKRLIGICSKYLTSFGVEVGYRMCCFPAPKDSQKQVLEIKEGDEINGFAIGYSSDDEIVYLKFKSKDGEILSWGEEQEGMEFKSVESYSRMWLIGYLGHPTHRKNPNEMIIKGLGFEIVTTSQKP